MTEQSNVSFVDAGEPCTNVVVVICIYAYSNHKEVHPEDLCQLMVSCVSNDSMDSTDILRDDPAPSDVLPMVLWNQQIFQKMIIITLTMCKEEKRRWEIG